jgi:hypothetical protein
MRPLKCKWKRERNGEKKRKGKKTEKKTLLSSLIVMLQA